MNHSESEFNSNPRSESQQGNRGPAPKLVAADYQSGEQLAHRTVGDVADHGFPNFDAHMEASARTVMPPREGEGKRAPQDFGFPQLNVQSGPPKALDASQRRPGDELRDVGFPPLPALDFSRMHRDVRSPKAASTGDTDRSAPAERSEKPNTSDKGAVGADAVSQRPVKASDSFRETTKYFDQLNNIENPAAVARNTIRSASALAPELRAAGKNDEVAATLFSQATTKLQADHPSAGAKLLRGMVQQSLSANPESPEPDSNWTTPRRMTALTRRNANGR
jgi:hypothetical protein